MGPSPFLWASARLQHRTETRCHVAPSVLAARKYLLGGGKQNAEEALEILVGKIRAPHEKFGV